MIESLPDMMQNSKANIETNINVNLDTNSILDRIIIMV